jgi:transcriptional regulator GlxA family with amidase domain
MAVRVVGVLLFEGFEVLDVYGPIECFSKLTGDDAVRLLTVAAAAGPVASAQGTQTIADVARDACPPLDLLIGMHKVPAASVRALSSLRVAQCRAAWARGAWWTTRRRWRGSVSAPRPPSSS